MSTDDQDAALQTDALAHRPQLDRMLDQLRTGDVVVVWRLDRLGRSLKNLISLVDELADRGVGFRRLSESIDTTTANGKLFFFVAPVAQPSDPLQGSSSKTEASVVANHEARVQPLS